MRALPRSPVEMAGDPASTAILARNGQYHRSAVVP
jgi:hypothetical protein